MSAIPYPTIIENGKPTHVVLPLDAYFALVEEKGYPPYNPDIKKEGAPAEVAFAVLEGANPLKAWRNHLGLTQEEVAEKMGVKRPAYTQMEQSGRPQQKTLERAAKVFGASVSALAELYAD